MTHEAALTDVTLCVLERPDDAVDDQLLVLWGDLEKGAKAVCVDRFQEAEELQPVFREVLQEQKNIRTEQNEQQNEVQVQARSE